LRYARLETRDHRHLTAQEATRRDLHELKILRKADTIVLADCFVLNNGERSLFLRTSIGTIARYLDEIGITTGASSLIEDPLPKTLDKLEKPGGFEHPSMLWLLAARALLENDPVLAWRVAEQLGWYGASEGCAFLLRLGRQPDVVLESTGVEKPRVTSLHSIAAQALGRIGCDVTTVLQLFNVEDNATRVFAADALGEIGDPSAFAPLLTHIENDPDDDVAMWSGRSVAKVSKRSGDTSVSEQLVSMVQELRNRRQEYAFDALVRVDRPAAARLLKDLEGSNHLSYVRLRKIFDLPRR
jgi:hypothetical protein